MPSLTGALRAEYQQLFDSCQIRPERQAEVNTLADRALDRRPRYEAVAQSLGLPWYVVAVIHQMEASARFDAHLHNGDPLGARTVHVPAGRPSSGAPPFSWEISATDALRLARYDQWHDWSVPGILFKWESYNGWGYRNAHPEVKSPYLWSYTSHYLRGKYVADGTFSASAVSKQAGAAALLRRLAEKGVLQGQANGSGTGLAGNGSPATTTAAPQPAHLPPAAVARLRFSPAQALPDGIALQHFLNQFPDIFLREDGLLGPRSSDAFRQVFGQYLQGDPRGG
jgi:lysozyme family protein